MRSSPRSPQRSTTTSRRSSWPWRTSPSSAWTSRPSTTSKPCKTTPAAPPAAAEPPSRCSTSGTVSPWTAAPDPSTAINAQRAALRDERDRIEDRLGEIEAAEKIAALRADNPQRGLQLDELSQSIAADGKAEAL
ncbi:hypothetical protein ACPPVO_36095 [Dactylosporangium sp. McL0621]|uniref:hypothetical protein n=1 Tax=Dactylosporangium sp. McL0621 TaxID=3415678 RepID=UPI003CF36487